MKMKLNLLKPTITAVLLAATLSSVRAADWTDDAISPVTNPLFFESPFIQSEVRPLFVYHNIDDNFIGGFARVYALQLRYAITERLALIATKDGYIQLRPDVPGLRNDGWGDISAGLKYSLVDDREHQFILTPGLKFELPSGSHDVFQANGDGEFDVFVSAAKGWGNFHVMASTGLRLPIDTEEENSSLHYSLQLDYRICQWFTPFVTLNGSTTLSQTKKGPAFGVEGYDLINFGSSNAGGFTEVAAGVGFRTRFCKWFDTGFAYEHGITHPRGLFGDRFTVDMIFRF